MKPFQFPMRDPLARVHSRAPLSRYRSLCNRNCIRRLSNRQRSLPPSRSLSPETGVFLFRSCRFSNLGLLASYSRAFLIWRRDSFWVETVRIEKNQHSGISIHDTNHTYCYRKPNGCHIRKWKFDMYAIRYLMYYYIIGCITEYLTFLFIDLFPQIQCLKKSWKVKDTISKCPDIDTFATYAT